MTSHAVLHCDRYLDSFTENTLSSCKLATDSILQHYATVYVNEVVVAAVLVVVVIAAAAAAAAVATGSQHQPDW